MRRGTLILAGTRTPAVSDDNQMKGGPEPARPGAKAALDQILRPRTRASISFGSSCSLALAFPLVGTLAGMVFSYDLNKRFTWRDNNLDDNGTSGVNWKTRAAQISKVLTYDCTVGGTRR